MIDKWYFSNLEERRDKVNAQELVAALQSFPAGVLERFPVATENESLPDTAQGLCKQMQADGFVEWDYEAIRHNNRHVTLLAADWTKLKMLRHIIETDRCAVLTTDNAYPIVPFKVIEGTVASCPSDRKALYLHWVNDPFWTAPDYEALAQQHYETLANMQPTDAPGVLDNFGGSGWIVCFTPAGAAEFLSLWKSIPSADGQDVLFYSKQHNPNLTGYYACNPELALSIFDVQQVHRNLGVISGTNALLRKDKSDKWDMRI